jgi:hypothetical protein
MRLERMVILDVPEGEERTIAAALAKNPNVEFAEPDWIARVGPCETSVSCDLPDGDVAMWKWDLHNPGTMDMALQGWGIVTTGKVDADIDWAETYDHLGANFAGSAVIGVLTRHPLPRTRVRGQDPGRPPLHRRTGQPVRNYTDDQGHGSHVPASRLARRRPHPGRGVRHQHQAAHRQGVQLGGQLPRRRPRPTPSCGRPTTAPT